MSMFIIVLSRPSEEQAKLIEENYPDFFPLSDTTYLVESDQLTQAVATNVGIRTDPTKGPGVVLGLSGTYSGFTDPAIWEWFKKMESKRE